MAIDSFITRPSSATRTLMMSSMEKYKQKRLSKTYGVAPMQGFQLQQSQRTWYGQAASNMVAAVFWSASTPQSWPKHGEAEPQAHPPRLFLRIGADLWVTFQPLSPETDVQGVETSAISDSLGTTDHGVLSAYTSLLVPIYWGAMHQPWLVVQVQTSTIL